MTGPVRWLVTRPPEPGVYRVRLHRVTRWVAAIPFDDGTWFEGPLRSDASRCVDDLAAEQALRTWLEERAA